jgi:hypothetical protein
MNTTALMIKQVCALAVQATLLDGRTKHIDRGSQVSDFFTVARRKIVTFVLASRPEPIFG